MAAGDNDGNLWVWNVESQKLLHSWQGHSATASRPLTVSTDLIGALVFSPDGQQLMSGGDSPDLVSWDVEELATGGNPSSNVPRDAQGWSFSPRSAEVISVSILSVPYSGSSNSSVPRPRVLSQMLLKLRSSAQLGSVQT